MILSARRAFTVRLLLLLLIIADDYGQCDRMSARRRRAMETITYYYFPNARGVVIVSVFSAANDWFRRTDIDGERDKKM